MRILTQKETKAKPDSLTDEVRKSLKLKRLIENNSKSYEELQASLDPRKQKIQKEFNEFLTSINKRKSELFSEVEGLEKRREKALEPLDDKWLELQEKEIILSDFEKRLKKQVSEIDTDKEQIKEQSAYIKGKEQELMARESSLIDKEKKCSQDEDVIKDLTEKLNIGIKDFSNTIQIREAELSQRETIVSDKEQSFGLITTAQDRREKDLDIYKKQLDDRQATLERGFDELRNQNGRR